MTLFFGSGLFSVCNHFETISNIPTFERLDDKQQLEHEVILEMVEKLKEFEMVLY